MNKGLLFLVLSTVFAVKPTENVISFDKEIVGKPPKSWSAGVTGQGAPRWIIEKDESAPSPPHVLKQSGKGTFPWCVKKDAQLKDGFVVVKFKAISGQEDQAGGLVWRWKDGDTYYVARANALENNVSLYYTLKGHRNILKYVDAPVAPGVWQTLRVEFLGKNITVLLNGKVYITCEDGHLSEPGALGVWTKADSVTSFDDFRYGTVESKTAPLFPSHKKDHP